MNESYIAFGSIRMEPVFMILGQSTGAAAVIACKNRSSVQDVNYEELLKQVLLSEDQVIEWDSSIKDDPVARMKETFGKE